MSAALQELGLVPFFTQQLADTNLLDSRVGRVASVQRSSVSVLGAGDVHTVGLSPILKQAKPVDRPTVGDWIVMDESLTRIEQVLERKSLFKRIAAGSRTEFQAVAANIDILFIVTSCNQEFKEARLERYLALCDDAGAMPVIVLTKIDLADDKAGFVSRARSIKHGVPVETANALDPTTLDGVRAWISDNCTVALVGSSGVGKSTLLNSLAKDSVAATNEIRERDKKGRHTTTHRELHRLPSGGLVIDVPGMRELRLAEVERSLGMVFEDIEILATHCQFADCKHASEPGCAVLKAIEESRLDERRLLSYRKLRRESALASATLAEKRARERSFGKMVKEVKLHKQRKGVT